MNGKYSPMVWYSNSTLQGTNINELPEQVKIEMLKLVGDIPNVKSFFYFISNDKINIIVN